MGYLANFIVYTFAMVGVVVIALLVFKNSTGISTKNSSKFLKVHDTLSIGPRKTLYIVSAGNEKFLIAGDVDKTSLISKLNTQEVNNESMCAIKEFQETTKNIATKKSSYMDGGKNGIYNTQIKPYSSVMKNLAERMKDVSIK